MTPASEDYTFPPQRVNMRKRRSAYAGSPELTEVLRNSALRFSEDFSDEERSRQAFHNAALRTEMPFHSGGSQVIIWATIATILKLQDMPRVFIPTELRSVSRGIAVADVEGATVRLVLDSLEKQFPGISKSLLVDDRLRPDLTVVVDSRVSVRGLREPVGPNSEVQFLPPIGGG